MKVPKLSNPTKLPSVLIVDDDENSRKALRSVLSDLDVPVDEAASGEEVLRKALREDFLMIILDIRLPGIDGFETAKILRERDNSRDTPILFLTGVDKSEANAKRGYDLHAVDYMIKPVPIESLRSKVNFAISYQKKLRVALENEHQIAVKLSGANQQLELVLNTATNGIIALDANKMVLMANPTARHILGGITRDVPFSWPDNIIFLDTENLQPIAASSNPIRRALAGEMLYGETHIITRVTGQEHRYVRVSSAPAASALAHGDASTISAVIVIDDITEHEKSKQKIERSSRLDALGQLTGGIAHDFNNLLATIQYALMLMSNGGDEKAQTTYMKTAQSAVERGSALTSRLLAFAKRQPGKARSALVKDVMHDFATLSLPAVDETISLTCANPEDEMLVFCDIPQLENALLNLVINSRDAITRSGSGDAIVVSARPIAEIEVDEILRTEDPNSYIARGMHDEHANEQERADGKAYRYVEFAVTDNGPGMSDEVKRRSIDPFFTTSDGNSGTGLGLSIVYGFVQQFDGELRIYSEEGHGTTVRIILPRGTEQGSREEPVERLPQPTGFGQRIFVVEDEENLLEMLTGVITSLGYTVSSARSGKEALEVLKKDASFDLLLTDIVMPGGIGGFELARQVSKLQPDMAIIYMSGYTGFSEAEMGEIVAPMIQKPSPPNELAEALQKALEC